MALRKNKQLVKEMGIIKAPNHNKPKEESQKRDVQIKASSRPTENPIFKTGILLIRFEGDSVMNIRDRLHVKHQSIINQFERCIDFYSKHVNIGELIDGVYRKTIEEIPLVAYRETIANAIVHRDYEMGADIKIEFFDSRIEVVSPGGLPRGISEEEFLDGRISICRNPAIASIFMRMGIIERLATGIRRIKESYQYTGLKPQFHVAQNSIKVVLPKINEKKMRSELIAKKNASESHETFKEQVFSEDEERICNHLKQHKKISRKEVEALLELKKTQTIKILNQLIEKNEIERVGKGNKIYYKEVPKIRFESQ
jgi:ATP-dependent DNA helicase RecG